MSDVTVRLTIDEDLLPYVAVFGDVEEVEEPEAPLHEHQWVVMKVLEENQYLPVTTFCECGLTAVDLVPPGEAIPGFPCQCDGCLKDCE